MSQPSALKVSLESHLLATLRVVRKILPDELQVELANYITQPPKATIPHPVLQKVSEWSRTDGGLEKLRSKSLKPEAYGMISLLAGTTTSPEKNFGHYVPPLEPEVLAANRAKERKAITALVNSVFSVIGAGFAAWWGADKTGWRDEYKVLFGLAVGIVVAVSEGVLFVLWSNPTLPYDLKKKWYTTPEGKDEAEDEPQNQTEPLVVKAAAVKLEEKNTLRQRHL